MWESHFRCIFHRLYIYTICNFDRFDCIFFLLLCFILEYFSLSPILYSSILKTFLCFSMTMCNVMWTCNIIYIIIFVVFGAVVCGGDYNIGHSLNHIFGIVKVGTCVMNLVYLLSFSFLFFSILNNAFIIPIPCNYYYFPYYYTNRVMWPSITLSSQDSWHYYSFLRPACDLGYTLILPSFYGQSLVISFIYSFMYSPFIYSYISDLISDHNQCESY